jgi:nitrous oxidase accessory protein
MEGPRSVRKKVIRFIFLFFLGVSTASMGAVLKVQQGTRLSSLTAAVSLAKPYDTILVHAGVYAEKNILINKPVFITGTGWPVFDGQHKNEIISVWSSDVTIEKLVLRNSGKSGMIDIAAIKIYNASRVTIRSNKVQDAFFGIYFQDCTNSTVFGNVLNSNGVTELESGNGLHFWKCDSMNILSNTVSGHRDGIYFEFVTNSTIRKNTSFGNVRYGLHFMFSHHNEYLYNTFKGNGAGVAVMYTHHVKMFDNVFINNWGGSSYGILLKEITDSEITHNQFVNNTSGIYMEGSNRITIKNNKFENNGCALRIQASCDNNTITNNNFTGNTFDVTTNGTLILNKFYRNYWDKYEGYDLDKNGEGDIPYHPVSIYSMIIERIPVALIFIRSFMVTLLERTERAIPSMTPENFKDETPLMKPVFL